MCMASIPVTFLVLALIIPVLVAAVARAHQAARARLVAERPRRGGPARVAMGGAVIFMRPCIQLCISFVISPYKANMGGPENDFATHG